MSLVVLFFFFLMIRRPPRSTPIKSSAASDVYKRSLRVAAHRMIVGLTHYSWASSTGAEHRSTVDADDVNFNLDKIP